MIQYQNNLLYLTERLSIQFYKILLKAKISSSNLMFYDELGRHLISEVAKSKNGCQ